jgi:hypothetical protein
MFFAANALVQVCRRFHIVFFRKLRDINIHFLSEVHFNLRTGSIELRIISDFLFVPDTGNTAGCREAVSGRVAFPG